MAHDQDPFVGDRIILIICAIFTILGNTLVLVATWRETSLHQPNKYFIACLAVADILVGMILEPLKVHELSNLRSLRLCRFIVWIDTFALVASIYTLTFISFDRYLKISKPLPYRSQMTTSISLKIIFIIWFISTAFATYAAIPNSGSFGILFSVTRIYCNPEHGANKNTIGFYNILAACAFFLPITVILIMYAAIFAVVRRRQRMLRNGELGQTSNDRNQQSVFLQDLKVIRMLFIVVGVFVLCWAPYFIYILLLFHQALPTVTIKTHTAMTILPYFNSLCNPIIYAFLDKTYRGAFKNLFQRMMCRTSSGRRQPPNQIELHPLRPR